MLSSFASRWLRTLPCIHVSQANRQGFLGWWIFAKSIEMECNPVNYLWFCFFSVSLQVLMCTLPSPRIWCFVPTTIYSSSIHLLLIFNIKLSQISIDSLSQILNAVSHTYTTSALNYEVQELNWPAVSLRMFTFDGIELSQTVLGSHILMSNPKVIVLAPWYWYCQTFFIYWRQFYISSETSAQWSFSPK